MGHSIAVYVAALVLLTSGSLAATWYVTPDGTGDVPTIQAAVDSASAGDVILLADGTFSGEGNRDIEARKSVTFRSESGDPQACVIDADGSAAQHHRVFYRIDGSYARLEGITLRHGYANGSGALDLVWDLHNPADVAITNCRFIDNHSTGYAGALGVFVGNNILRISDCLFSGNSAEMGGGAMAFSWHFDVWASIEIDNCIFVGNDSFYGCILYEWFMTGAPLNEPGCATLEGEWVRFSNCTIVGNSGGVLKYENPWSKANTAPGLGDPGLQQYYYWSISQTIIAHNDLTYVIHTDIPLMTCVDMYGNSCGDWVSYGSDQYGIRGNFMACPSFCNETAGDFMLCNESSCLPGNHPDGYECGLVGALGEGCTCGPSRTGRTFWGAIKAIYR
jgi:hypothetical protein